MKNLTQDQNVDKHKAELIELNKELVDKVILQTNAALANQLSWQEIQDLVDEAKLRGDPIAALIKNLKLDINHVVLQLADPFAHNSYSSDNDNDDEVEQCEDIRVLVDIDLNLSK